MLKVEIFHVTFALKTLDAKRKALTMVDDLKAKGNFQLVDTIKTIEYQILLIVLYFVMAVFINWYNHFDLYRLFNL